MANKQECDRYATEIARRFEEFTQWAITNWPEKNFPLLSSEFAESRKEIGMILGSKLQQGQQEASSGSSQEPTQYVDVNPAPWP